MVVSHIQVSTMRTEKGGLCIHDSFIRKAFPDAPWDGNIYLHFPLNVAIFHRM